MSKTNEEMRPAPPPSAEEQLEALNQEKQELYERLLRTAAEFENWKKRTRKEQETAAARGRAELVRELLPVLDNLDRALRHGYLLEGRLLRPALVAVANSPDQQPAPDQV